MTEELATTYRRQYLRILLPIAERLEIVLQGHLRNVAHVDRITARAKSPDRFLAKAAKRSEDGSPKYTEPLLQIQDQIGARVIVLYNHDIESIEAAVRKYYPHIERREHIPDHARKFGYVGLHYILALPGDAIPAELGRSDAPELFELQIKTVWQHAWSECEHDLGYKPSDKLTIDQERRLAFTAAQAWGADHIFDELFAETQE